MNRLWLSFLLLLVTAIWGWTFVVVKQAIAAYGVISFLAVRFVIATLALGILVPRRIPRRTLTLGAGIGCILAPAYLFQTFGLNDTSPTNCGLITGLFVVCALLINRICYGIRLRLAVWCAVGVSLIGLFLLTGAGPSPPTLGDALTLGAAFCFGLQIVLLDRYAKGHDPAALTLMQLAVAATIFVAAWPALAAVAPTAARFAWPTSQVWFALAVTGILATAVGFYVQVLVQQHLSAVQTALILTLEPVFAAVFGYLLAEDRLIAIQLAGAALMVAAVTFSEVSRVWGAEPPAA